jgi:GTP-binding protein
MLGVVEVGMDAFVLADIPGLIEGAHRGVGLGHDFLRHIERTRVLIHLLDGTSPSPRADLEKLNEELALFDPSLSQKPQVVAVNKLDLTEVRERRSSLEGELGGGTLFLSAVTLEGVDALLAKTLELLKSLGPVGGETPQAAFRVFRPRPRPAPLRVVKGDGVFSVSGKRAEELVSMTDLGSREARQALMRQLARIGVARALRQAGARPGDRVRFGEVELEWEPA